jgi:hypothetical protein
MYKSDYILIKGQPMNKVSTEGFKSHELANGTMYTKDDGQVVKFLFKPKSPELKQYAELEAKYMFSVRGTVRITKTEEELVHGTFIRY